MKSNSLLNSLPHLKVILNLEVNQNNCFLILLIFTDCLEKKMIKTLQISCMSITGMKPYLTLQSTSIKVENFRKFRGKLPE